MPPDDLLRIGELSRRTDTSPELLRAWELRYGLPRPTRSAGGFRLSSGADEARVRRMRGLQKEGLSAAEAARLVTAQPLPAPDGPAALRDAGELTRALEGFDEPGAQATFDRLLGAVSVDTLLRDV